MIEELNWPHTWQPPGPWIGDNADEAKAALDFATRHHNRMPVGTQETVRVAMRMLIQVATQELEPKPSVFSK